MKRRADCDVVVLGGGAAGLSVTAGLAQFGLDVVLAEPGPMGGECLNTGCVPSKALLSIASEVAAARGARHYGLELSGGVDWHQVRGAVQAAIASIAPHDSQNRFEGLGARVVRAPGYFKGPGQIAIGDAIYTARYIVIATGSRPLLPNIPGLTEENTLTNENLWTMEALPERLAVVGGGAMGVEMAQAFARLGSSVTLIHRGSRLLRDFDGTDAAVVGDALRRDGVSLLLDTEIEAVTGTQGALALHLSGGTVLETTHLLMATGRRVDLTALNPSAIGLKWDETGIAVDAALRTSAHRVFALGDCTRLPRLTHAAGAAASVVVRQIAFGLPARFDFDNMVQAVYCDPPIARVGAPRGRRQWIRPYASNDRAIAEADTQGALTLITARGDTIIGAHGVGAGIDEAIAMAGVLIARKTTLAHLTSVVLPYPTRAELFKRLASDRFAPMVFGPLARLLVTIRRWLAG
jgi:pyruvate/2-oxoglutarate dehydrogenase complex dihydrolipoamide dehydrogenase (E3) component